MVSLLFLACLAGIILLVVALEADTGLQDRLRARPAGLLTWITGGNWPAKIGGALILVGVGALLRYALLNIDVSPTVKLGAGVLISFALGLGSTLLPEGPARRTISLVLAGAAFGVAYLTAYSAFGLFGYVPTATGLALLALVSAATGVYAVTRGAMSLAILAMLGAYLAPAFATEDPGPAVVYGYYAAASVMTLVLVALRGWRPLIHLSFLFTLAGGGFLAWTAQYHSGAHAGVMLPMLLLLAALHVAMPIVERGEPSARWVERLDVVYMIALPSVVAVLAFGLAQSRSDLAIELLWLGTIWAIAAAATRLRQRTGAAALALIAALFLVLAGAARFEHLPWELLGLAVSVVSLALATQLQPSNTRLHSVTAGFVALFGALHVVATIGDTTSGPLFANAVFLERATGALLVIIGGILCRRRGQALDTLLLATGLVWLFGAIGIELVRWELATVALVVHAFFVLVALGVWIPGRKLRWADDQPTLLAALVALTAWWAAHRADPAIAWVGIVIASGAVAALALRAARAGERGAGARFGTVVLAALTAALWAQAVRPPLNEGGLPFLLTLAGVVALLTLIGVHRVTDAHDEQTDELAVGAAIAFGTVLASATLIHISRQPWAWALELCCLAGLAVTTGIRGARGRPTEIGFVACIAALALIVQAHLLRWLGPPGPLSITSVLQLRLPAVVSLLWATMGSLLTFWSRRTGSRPLWIAGATLLIITAAKLLLVDFGSLGQLANILAVIAAGVVFLLVGWVAPMPPAKAVTAAPDAGAGPGARRRETKEKWDIVNIAALIAAALGAIEIWRLLTDGFVNW